MSQPGVIVASAEPFPSGELLMPPTSSLGFCSFHETAHTCHLLFFSSLGFQPVRSLPLNSSVGLVSAAPAGSRAMASAAAGSTRRNMGHLGEGWLGGNRRGEMLFAASGGRQPPVCFLRNRGLTPPARQAVTASRS